MASSVGFALSCPSSTAISDSTAEGVDSLDPLTMHVSVAALMHSCPFSAGFLQMDPVWSRKAKFSCLQASAGMEACESVSQSVSQSVRGP